MLYMATGKLAHLGLLYSSTLLLTNLQPKWASLPVAIYSICTPDDGWDCHPKHVELAIAKNNKRNCCILLDLFTTIMFKKSDGVCF